MHYHARHFLCGIALFTTTLGAGCAPSAPTNQQAQTQPSIAAAPTLSAFDTVGGTFSVDPCALISPSDARTLLEGPIINIIRSTVSDPAGTTCTYYTDKTKGPLRELIIIALESDNIKKSNYEKDAKEYFAYIKDIFYPDAETVTNLGDGAFYSDRSLEVLKGEVVIDVHVQGFDEGPADTEDLGPKDKKAILDAAMLAVSRLQ